MRAALLSLVLLSGCVTVGEAGRCTALRDGLERATSECERCLSGLSVHGEREACTALCEQPGKVAPLALNHCAAAALEQLQAKHEESKR